MSSIYANTGVDIDLIFDKGTGASMTDIIDDTGQDIGYKFSAGSADWDTGLVSSSGQDIGRILGGATARIWYSKETGLSTASSTVIDQAWGYATDFKETDKSWTKLGDTQPELSIGKHGYSKKSEANIGAYAFHVRLASTDGDVAAKLGALDSSGGGEVGLTEVRSPDSATRNFVVWGKGGAKYYIEYDEDDYAQETPIYVYVYSYVTLTITAKISGTPVWTKSVKFKF